MVLGLMNRAHTVDIGSTDSDAATHDDGE
jgi:hypothetical protein